MHIRYLSAPAGVGKTRALVDIYRLTHEGERVILYQPSIRLIQETETDLHQRCEAVFQLAKAGN